MAKAIIANLNEAAVTTTDGIKKATDLVHSGNDLILTVKKLVNNLMPTVDDTIKIYAFLKQEETRNVEECTLAVKQVLEAVEHASNVVRYVDDLTHYGGGEAMKVAKEKLVKKNPKFAPLDEILGQLEKTLSNVSQSYKTFKSASEAASTTCTAAASICYERAIEEAKKKTVTQAVGGTLAGVGIAAGVGTGVGLSIVAGVFTFGIGTVVGLGLTAAGAAVAGVTVGTATAVATHLIASSYEESKTLFTKVSDSFGDLFKHSIAFHQCCVNIKNGIDHTRSLIEDLKGQRENNTSIALINDTFNRLYEVFQGSHKEIGILKEELNKKKEQLKKQMDDS